jgi:tellurite resistance protein TehA-like permease
MPVTCKFQYLNSLVCLTDIFPFSLPRFQLISPLAGEVWYASGVLDALCLFGLALFFFVFGVLPYPFKVHKHLSEILGCWALTFPNGMLRLFAFIKSTAYRRLMFCVSVQSAGSLH